jgi:hypothetical protein
MRSALTLTTLNVFLPVDTLILETAHFEPVTAGKKFAEIPIHNTSSEMP